jgi:glycosyltransferase involved in cell wall biosynthesis
MSLEHAEGAPPRLCFVVPALDGPISGGTLYNRELCEALAERGGQVTACVLDDPRLASLLAAADHAFVDTLYMDALPGLTGFTRGSLFLLTHYLPTLVTAGRAVDLVELSAAESGALRVADGFLVTSDFMREALAPLVAQKQAILVVQPGSRARLAPLAERSAAGPLRALLVANLLPGKRVLALLEALRSALRQSDRFELSIIGRFDADPEYAAHCARLIACSPELSTRVTLRGASSHEHVLTALAAADLLLSASGMESYGMALGEARVTGVPIIACAGGHSAAHVDPRAGGQLVKGAEELAIACLALARAPEVLAERSERARRHALPARPWTATAAELLDQLQRLESREK